MMMLQGVLSSRLVFVAVVLTGFFPAPASAQPLNDQVAVIVRQGNDLATNVGENTRVIATLSGRLNRVEAGRGCGVGDSPTNVPLPEGGYVVGCFNRAPTDRMVNAFLTYRRQIRSLQAAVRLQQQHQQGVERVITTFFACGDPAACEAAAEQARQRLEAAYNVSVRLSAWALAQNAFDEAVVGEFTRLRDVGAAAETRLQDIERWRREVLEPRLRELERVQQQHTVAIAEIRQEARENQNRLTMSPGLSFLQTTCPPGNDCWSAGLLSLAIDGRVARTSPVFGQFLFGIGWGASNRSWGANVTVLHYGLGIGYRFDKVNLSAGAQGFSLLGSYVGGGGVMTGWGPYARASVDLGPVELNASIGGLFGSGADETDRAMFRATQYQAMTASLGVGWHFRAF